MLEPLFEAELDYQPGMAPLASEGDGALIGSGDGTVRGPKLDGKLEWTLFERPGYGSRPSQDDPAWRVAATLHFTTDDSRYSWLDGALALWEGEFSEVTGHARYTAFM